MIDKETGIQELRDTRIHRVTRKDIKILMDTGLDRYKDSHEYRAR